jgi:exosortase A-associated hydrolase 2
LTPLTYRSGFFPNRRGARLFFAEDLPADTLGDTAWLICSPILEEKNVAHGALVTLGRALAAQGVRAVRIDYEGHGDSDGDTAGGGLAEWVDDVRDAAEWLKQDGVRRLTLFGCRAGALIAAQAGATLAPDRFVAWCPVVKGEDHVQEILRLNLTTQMAVHKRVVQNREALVTSIAAGTTLNIVGWPMGRRLLWSLSTASLAEALGALTCPVEILDLVRAEGDAVPAGTAALAAPPRVVARGIPGLQFWIDGNYIDYRQEALVRATAALAAAPGG